MSDLEPCYRYESPAQVLKQAESVTSSYNRPNLDKHPVPCALCPVPRGALTALLVILLASPFNKRIEPLEEIFEQASIIPLQT